MAKTKRAYRRLDKKNELRHRLTCEWCGESFLCSRSGAKTCAAKCRTAYCRWRNRWQTRHGFIPTLGPRGVWEQQMVPPAPPKSAPKRKRA